MKTIFNRDKKIIYAILGFITFSLHTAYGLPVSQFPPTLPEVDSHVAANTHLTVKTPEYVILRANEESTFSSEMTGKVIYLPVKEGSNFKKDDVLLRLNCQLQDAEFKKAKAEQRSTNKALQSAMKLKTYGAISELELVKTRSEAEVANAEVDKLKAILEKCMIVAPFTGGVTEVRVHLYETVKPGDPLLKVINIKDLAVEVQVPSKWLSWLHVGSEFNVHVNDINKTIQAKVSYINPAIEPISQTVKIAGKIVAPEANLKPGMTGQAFFVENPENKKEGASQ